MEIKLLKDVLTLKNAVEEFLQYQTACGRADNTIKAYRSDLNLLIGWTENSQAGSLDSTIIDRFLTSDPVIKSAIGKLKSDTSINRIRSAVKSLFNWLTAADKIESNPAALVKLKKNTRKPPVFLNDREYTSLLKTIKPNSAWPAQRDLAIVILFRNTGIRLAELTSLNVEDVNLDDKQIVIKAKGGKIVTKFINLNCRQALKAWLRLRKKLQPDTDALFPSQIMTRITTRQIQKRLNLWSDKAGIEKNISPYVLRHTFATRLYSQNSNLRLVQKALGHVNISTTQIYTHVLDEEMENALEEL